VERACGCVNPLILQHLRSGFYIFITISKQVKFFFGTDLGFSKEQLMAVTAFPTMVSMGEAGMGSIQLSPG
jgi:hypothetical protein